MFMSDEKKKVAAPILHDDSAEYDGHHAAAEEILHAIDSKDPQALKEAMKSFVSMCMDNSDAEEAAE